MDLIPAHAAPVTAVASPDAERAIAVLVSAFCADPVARWVLRDPKQYLEGFPHFLRLFGGKAFDLGTAYQVNDYSGAALMLPPGCSPDHEALDAITPADCRSELGAVFESLDGYHPAEPHWYLPLIGVDIVAQRQGLGAALLQSALRQCDQDHAPVYLESTNAANIKFYRRHGFELLDTVQIGSVPPFFPMCRPAR